MFFSPALFGKDPIFYRTASGTNIQTYAGGSYFITNISGNIILPTIANVGDTIRLIIPNANDFSDNFFNILQNPGQRIVTWSSLNYTPPVVSSADGSRLLVNAGQGFYLSTNFTASWTVQLPLEPWPTPNGYSAFQMSADGSHIFAGVNFNYFSGIIVSGDYGQSWILNTNIALNGYGIQSIACSTNGVKAAAAVYYVGIFTSTDARSNWTLQTSAPTNANWRSVASSADGTKLVAVASGWSVNAGGIYTSGNSGITWTPQTNAPTNAAWSSVASSADGTKLVAASVENSASGIYTSVNSGSTWLPQTNGLPQPVCYSVASSADGLKLATLYNWSQLYTSVDLGNTWISCSTLPANPSVLIAVTSLGTSGGVTFSVLNNNELTLVYLGNGMFAIADHNDNFYGY